MNCGASLSDIDGAASASSIKQIIIEIYNTL